MGKEAIHCRIKAVRRKTKIQCRDSLDDFQFRRLDFLTSGLIPAQ
jgi:hypothetical protein